jgi:hypothetical protein
MGLHFVVADNILALDANSTGITGAATGAVTGITVSDSEDIAIRGNNIRGFATAISVAGKDRIQIRSNSIDVSHSPAARGVFVDAAVSRVVAADNAITGASSASTCVDIAGTAGRTRVSRNNECW